MVMLWVCINSRAYVSVCDREKERERDVERDSASLIPLLVTRCLLNTLDSFYP